MVSSDGWKAVSNYVFHDYSNNYLKLSINNNIVFCKIDHALKLFENLRLQKNRIILITGDGDLPCDGYRQRFMPANVIHWFATNVTQAHPRVTALPLGLGSARDPVTLSEEQIKIARDRALPRNKWLYVNFRPQTNLVLRQPILNHFLGRSILESWITMGKTEIGCGNIEFLHNLMIHRFVVCPPGNGVDTHRMWETLAAGAIPVVLRSQAMEPFKEMPVLFVNRYEEVTLEVLKKAADKISPAKMHEPMLQAEFWTRKINAAKLDLLGREIMPWGEWIMESVRYGASMISRRLLA
jgi:hypothetical protein